MAMPRQASTRARVQVIAPSGAKMAFDSREADSALLAIDVSKDLGTPCGSFTLHLAPGRDQDGRRWDQIIPRRSLVFIDLERPGPSDLPEGSATVMVGLTDDHGMQEQYSEAKPQRRVQIHGRDLTAIIVDAMLWFNMALARHPAFGTLTLHSLEGETQVAVSYNPNLARAMEDPRVILSRVLDYYLYVGGQAVAPAETPNLQRPVIGLDLPDVTLADLLDKNASAWRLFEPGVTVQIVQHPQADGSVWNYLHNFIDRAFQEFFTRIEDGVCRIHFRGKPFRHTRVTSGTRFKSSAVAGAPAPDDPTVEPTLQTLTLDPDDLLAIQVQMQTSNVLNVFLAGPKGLSDLYEIPALRYRLLPQIVTDHRHPSFVGRYGLRVLEVESPYLSPLQRLVGTAPQGLPLERQPVTAAQYAPLANQVAAQQGIPAPLRPWFVANIHAESAFNPDAQSYAGAQGLGQLMPATQAQVGVTQPFDPVQSLTGSAKYWNVLRAYPFIGDQPELIVAAYNAGPGAVQTHGGIPPFHETEQHVRKVTSLVPRYDGFAGSVPAAPLSTPTALPGAALTTDQRAGIEDMLITAQRWSAILACWYDMGGEMFGGTLVVRGHPAWNIGHRLLSKDEHGEWEAYIEGIGHRYDMRSGQYLTHLRITRGWYLSAAHATQVWEEGQTQITGTVGGPPEIDPAVEKEVIVQFPDFPEYDLPETP